MFSLFSFFVIARPRWASSRPPSGWQFSGIRFQSAVIVGPIPTIQVLIMPCGKATHFITPLSRHRLRWRMDPGSVSPTQPVARGPIARDDKIQKQNRQKFDGQEVRNNFTELCCLFYIFGKPSWHNRQEFFVVKQNGATRHLILFRRRENGFRHPISGIPADIFILH